MQRFRFLTFMWVAVASFVGCYALVIGAINALLYWPSVDPPPSYGAFLIRTIPPPRIIVDGGSNAVRSIMFDVLERRFGRHAIVIADNAAIPFEARLRRLERYAAPGDVVIMALEWSYYRYPDVYWSHLGVGAFGPYNDYYRLLGFWRRLDLIGRELGFRGVWRGMRAANRTTLRNTFSDEAIRAQIFARLEARLAERPGGDLVGEDAVRGTYGSCRRYIGYLPNVTAPGIGRIAEGLARFQREKNVTVAIAWPAVTGADCYPSDLDRSALTSSIREVLARHGIKVLGDPSDSAFPESALLDTFYHVKPDEARIRTERLIAALAAAMIVPTVAPPHEPTAVVAARELTEAQDRFNRTRAGRLATLRSGRFAVGTSEFERRFILARGWHETENWGVWSRGTESSVLLRPASRPCRLKFESRMSGGPESIVSAGASPPRPELGQWIRIPPGAEPVTVQFRHFHVVSPLALQLSGDYRPIKYALVAVNVDCGGARD
jgi:hypothetical protein